MNSRFSKSIKNARVAFIFYFIALLLAFISRKVFIETLGTELVGLSATMRNILGFLNLAELGVYTAVATSLYKPIFDKNEGKINEIISLFGFFYRIIGFGILGLGIIVSAFLPLIFSKTDLDFLILYAAFYTFLTVTLVSYFNNYKQVLLAADQRTYVVTKLTNWTNIIKVTLQIVSLKFLNGNYFWWLGIELVFGLALRFWINRTIEKQYPWLKTNIRDARMLINKYKEILVRVKQLFIHKIAEFTVFQTSQILVYALTTLTMVTFYTNYTMIFTKVSKIISATLGSNLAGIGNVIAENNPNKTRKVFWEFNALFFWVAGILIFSFYYLTEPFIIIWLGKEFILSRPVFLVMLFNVFILITRQTIMYFTSGYALFKDTWAPWVEAGINLGIAIGVGHFYGLLGVVLGIAISSLVIVVIWKPYFLYREGFKEKIWGYWINILRYMVIFAFSWAAYYPIIVSGILPEPSSYFRWILMALMVCLPFSIIYGVLLYIGAPGMKHLYQRMIPIVVSRSRKS